MRGMETDMFVIKVENKWGTQRLCGEKPPSRIYMGFSIFRSICYSS